MPSEKLFKDTMLPLYKVFNNVPDIFFFTRLVTFKVSSVRNSTEDRKEHGRWYETDLVHVPLGLCSGRY